MRRGLHSNACVPLVTKGPLFAVRHLDERDREADTAMTSPLSYAGGASYASASAARSAGSGGW